MISKTTSKNLFKEWSLFLGVLLLFGPISIWARFYLFNNALIEPHPWRQTQTALTILQLFKGTGSLWDYRSPLSGMLWNNVYEFPIYQWVVSLLMKLGMGIEVSSRLVTLVSFCSSAWIASLIIKEFCTQKTAYWFLLLYLVNPFGVIFSRVCLIDYFALNATLISVYSAIRIRAGFTNSRYWLGFAFGGLVAGLGKINIWFFVTAVVFGIIFLESIKLKQFNQKWKWGLVAALFSQVIIIFVWNYHRSAHLHSPADTPWLIGLLSDRFQWWRWKKIFWDFGARSLFFDFLIIPFVVGNLVAFTRYKSLFFIVWGIVIGHTLIFFQVQTYHDYYLIASMPYLYWLVAVGMEFISESSRPGVLVLKIAFFALMIYKVTKLPVYFSPILHDYRPELKDIYALKKYTVPDDLIYWDAKQGRFEIATYSERNVGLSETFKLIGTTDEKGEIFVPSVFRFDSKQIPFEVLDRYSHVWIEGDKEFKLYRTEGRGSYAFDPMKHLGVVNELPIDSSTSTFKTSINNCGAPFSLIIPIPKNTKQVLIEANGFEVVFPGNKFFLNIPATSDWACDVKLILVK